MQCTLQRANELEIDEEIQSLMDRFAHMQKASLRSSREWNTRFPQNTIIVSWLTMIQDMNHNSPGLYGRLHGRRLPPVWNRHFSRPPFQAEQVSTHSGNRAQQRTGRARGCQGGSQGHSRIRGVPRPESHRPIGLPGTRRCDAVARLRREVGNITTNTVHTSLQSVSGSPLW